jgi:hypothetical protein
MFTITVTSLLDIAFRNYNNESYFYSLPPPPHSHTHIHQITLDYTPCFKTTTTAAAAWPISYHYLRPRWSNPRQGCPTDTGFPSTFGFRKTTFWPPRSPRTSQFYFTYGGGWWACQGQSTLIKLTLLLNLKGRILEAKAAGPQDRLQRSWQQGHWFYAPCWYRNNIPKINKQDHIYFTYYLQVTICVPSILSHWINI